MDRFRIPEMELYNLHVPNVGNDACSMLEVVQRFRQD